MRLDRELRVAAPSDRTWAAVAGGGWAGPVRVAVDGAGYAGALRLLDVDEDERHAGAYAQLRRDAGWAGVAATFALRPADGGLAVDGEALFSGEASSAAVDALLDELAARLQPSLADDPAWRRKLAVRAGIAVAVGVAAGLAGAAWDRRRRE